MRVRRSQPAFTSLDLLVHFLNFNFSSASKIELPNDPAVRLLLDTVYKSNLRRGLRDAKRIQKQLVAGISPLIAREEVEDPEGYYGDVQFYLQTLVDITNRMRLKSEWIVAFGDQELRIHTDEHNEALIFKPLTSQNPFLMGTPPLGPTQRILKMGNTKWIIYRRLYDESSLRKWLYGILISVLETGDFGSFRKCVQCQAFFIANDARKHFCGNNCKNNFNNKRRQEEGYFADYRAMSRKGKLDTARKLLNSGKPPYEVIDETGLSGRVLIKAGLLERSR